MFKNIYFRLGIISVIASLSFLAALPRTPIIIKNKYLNVDSSVGGYYLSFFGGRIKADFRQLKKGLDLEGGIRIVLKANMDKISQNERKNALESAQNIISKRVNLLGVSEPNISTTKSGDDYKIIVEIPGVEDVASAVNLIGQTAQLKFKQLKADKEWDEQKFQEYYLDISAWEDTNVSGADLKGVDVVFSQATTNANSLPQIQLKFTNEGRRKFSELAKKNLNKPVGLFLDKEENPLSMPVVSSDLASGLTDDPVITGNFDVNTAKALSIQIRAGALPVPVEVLEQKTVGATLGTESVRKSVFAGAIGLLFVLIFLVFLYGKLGLIADVALVIYAFIVIAIFKFVPVVLTLPGIAGFILSVGMASDANILVFERIREELSWGMPRGVAIKNGFERAFSSIKDSNMSSLLTAAVLFYFGSGAVRGFALTLSIGILISLFTSIFVTRTLVSIFSKL